MAITSFLSSVGGNLGNVLQALSGAPTQVADVPVTATRPVPQGAPVAATAIPQQTLARLPEREAPRRSMLQRIGGLADALATAGDAKPLYQPTLDARETRANQAQTLEQQRLGTVMKGYQAMLDNGVDPVQARTMLPQLMQQVNMTPEFANQVLSTVEQNPDALQGMLGLAGAAREPETFTGNPIYFRPTGDENGPLRVGFRGSRGTMRMTDAPEGYEVADQLQYLNLGDRYQGMGRYGGTATGPAQTRGVNPDVNANNLARRDLAEFNAENQMAQLRLRLASSEAIATMKAAGKSEEATGSAEAALGALDELEAEYQLMHQRGETITPDRNPVQNMINRGWASGIGQLVGGSIGSERQTSLDNIEGMRRSLLQAIVNATGMSAQQLNSNFELDNYLKTLTDPRASYEANRAAARRVRAIISGEAQPAQRPAPPPPPATRTTPAPSGRGNVPRATPKAAAAPSAPRVVNW